ncbi:mechanosensitive ion channel domain-containing protein [Schlesneria paludicola]|uniref:mechanosensitive ion channel domain-containing protein n=1 Tax=Schlesneria paludicola TaxID=360056 RepID=UPI00029B0A2B|nr:mechanosensitive ion channel domain-containing protein [Schlesneria paludicola]
MNWRSILVCSISLVCSLQVLDAQTTKKSDALTIDALKETIKREKTSSEYPAAIRDEVIKYLEPAIERLEIADEHLAKAKGFESRVQVLSDALRATQKKLAESPTAADPSIAQVADLDELQHLVDLRVQQLDDLENGLRKQISELEEQAEQRRVRPEELVKEMTEVDDRLQEIEAERSELAASSDPPRVIWAHRIFLQARRQRAESERRAMQAESIWLQSNEASDLLQVQQELAAKSLALKTSELDVLQKELAKRRGDEADQRVQHAEKMLNKVGPELKLLAEENVTFAKEQRDVTVKLREIESGREATFAALDDLKKEFSRTQKMVADVGLTDSIGLLLRQQRAKLRNTRTMKANLARRTEVVREVRMRLFQLDADQAALLDLDAAVVKHTEEFELHKDDDLKAAGLRELLVEQRQLCKGLDADYNKYFKQLIELDNVERGLLDLTRNYADYVDERVLWIRTGPVFGRDHLAKTLPAFKWISDSKTWKPVLDTVSMDIYLNPVLWSAFAAFVCLWIVFGTVLKNALQRHGQLSSEIVCRDLTPTLKAVSLTMLMACCWPSLFLFCGWRLDHSLSTTPFVHALAQGLQRAATFLFPLEVLRVVCIRSGLGERHFDWPMNLVHRWRRNLNWFLPIGVVAIGLIGLVEGTSNEHRLDSFGRLVFLAFAALSAIFSLLTVRRVRTRVTTSEGVAVSDTDLWSDRFWRFAPVFAIGACLGLLTLGVTGYFYTALQLTWRMQQTAWFVVGLILVRSVIRRWIALERRRMAVLQEEELQSLTEASHEPGNAGHNAFLFPRWNWPDFRLNLTQIVNQMRRLLDTGLITLAVIGMWIVWSDVTPALNIFDRVTLWQTTIQETRSVKDPKDPELPPVTQTVQRLKPVTAADLGLAALIVAIAVVAGRNIPGLVEVILLEHLSVDAGIRFAATCLVRYAIFITGVSCAFAQISIGWSNVQWLVAAASVGLGFGLQEIFGNFVSGIILLFERPMRVGDVITISDTTGTVSRIRFRATTIVDGDRKELIVPNKEFITGRLLNWTLSDRVNRVGVKVVVAQDNDPQRVRRLLLDIASQQPQLLKDPAPSAALEDLNGGLTFTVRGFLPSLEGRATTIHELCTTIHSRFKAEGIEMSWPTSEVFVHMEPHEAHAPIPSSPHQPPGGTPLKQLQPDFSSAFRRA